MSSTDEAVRLHNAVVLLGSFPALAEASLVVKKGEIVLISGANGAGKTTLLRLCAGLVPLARGEASVLGFNLATQRKEAQAHVGMLGHANGLYLDLTAQEGGSEIVEPVAVAQQGLFGKVRGRRDPIGDAHDASCLSLHPSA